MSPIVSDLSFALRLMAKSRGFAATVIAVLTLGVGANTAIFSVIHSVLLNPFPYAHSDRLLFIGMTQEGESGLTPVTYLEHHDLSRQLQTVEHLTWATSRAMTLTAVSEPALLNGAVVSASVWDLLGLSPQLGRTFTAAEDQPGAAPVAVLSAATWQGKFGGDPDVLGREVLLNGRAYTVVGVMPPRFKFWAADVWIPAGLEADTDLMRNRVLRMNSWGIGRMKAGATLGQVNTELAVVSKRISAEHPNTAGNLFARANPLAENVTGPVREPLLMLLGAVGFVLLIACANVANLLLARAATRQREFAIRAALGAGRARLIRQVLFEVLPLAVLGSLGGILAAAWGLETLLALLPAEAIPAEAVVTVNPTVMLVSIAVCVGTMLLFALLPAVELARTQFTGVLQEGGRGSGGPRSARVRAALIVAEVALSLVLLVGAGLLLRSFSKIESIQPGFNPANLLTVGLQLPEARYPQAVKAQQFYQELLERIRLQPGVKAVAAASNPPFLSGTGIPLISPDKTYSSINDLRGVQFNGVIGDYFAAQGLPLKRGRIFTEADRAGSEPVIILNEEAVRRFLPAGSDPLGQRVMLGIPENLLQPGMLPPGLDKFQWSTVVGVVADARHFGLQGEAPPAAYLPAGQMWDAPFLQNNLTVLVRTAGDPSRLAPAVRAAVLALDANQPLGRVAPMEAVIAESLSQSRFSTVLLGLFAAVAAILALVGIYGVVSWNVTQRTRELGIRTALGASGADTLRLVLWQGMRVVLLGLLVGLAGALTLSRVLGRMLYQTSPFDPWVFALMSLSLTVVALAACLVPALRATRVNPLVALRAE
jgi:putative ABC transport system permease protein